MNEREARLERLSKGFTDVGIDKIRGASLAARHATGAAETQRDRLATLRKFYPDAEPYGDDNFIFTSPRTGRKTIYNPKGFDAGDVVSVTPELAEIGGGAIAAAAALPPAVVSAPATGGQSLWSIPLAFGLGAGAGRELNGLLASNLAETVDTRGLGERSRDAAITVGSNAVSEGLFDRIGEFLGPIASRASRSAARGLNPEGASNAQVLRDANVTPRVGTVTGSDGAQLIEKGISSTPGGAGIMREAAERERDELAAEAGRIANEYGPRGEPEEVGAVIRKGADDAAARYKARQSDLYDAAYDVIPKGQPVTLADAAPLRAYRDDLAQKIAAAPQENGAAYGGTLKRVDGMLKDIEGGRVTFEELRRFRTNVGNDLSDPVIAGMTTTQRKGLDPVYGALTDTMNGKAGQFPNGQALLSKADRYTRFHSNQTLPILQRIKDLEFDEAVYNFALSGSKDGGSKLLKIRRNLTPEEWDLVAGTVLGRMGLPTAARQAGRRVGEAANGFSVASFLTNFSRMSPGAQNALFSGTRYKSLKPQLDNLVRAVELARNNDSLSNVSGTARVLLAAAGVLSAGGTVGGAVSGEETSGTITGALGTGAVSFFIAPRYAAKLITNPRFVGWLSQAIRLSTRGEGSFARHIGRLATIGEVEPEIKDAVREFAFSLTNE